MEWSDLIDSEIKQTYHYDSDGGSSYYTYHLMLQTKLQEKPFKIFLGRSKIMELLEVLRWFFFYMLLLFVKGTRALQVLKGIVIIVIIFLITKELQLETINWILTRLFTISIIAFLIIFQPELRRGLARIGQFGMFSRQQETLDEIVKAALILSKKKISNQLFSLSSMSMRPSRDAKKPVMFYLK